MKIYALALALGVSFLFCGCNLNAQKETASEAGIADIDAKTSASELLEEASEESFDIDTASIEAIRNEIASVSDISNKESLEKLEQYYDELRTRQALSQEDYESFCDICKNLDMDSKGYEILSEEFMYYPSKELAEKLENYIVEVNADAIDLTIVEKPDIELISSMITSKAWKDSFQFEDGTISKKSKVIKDSNIIQIEQNSEITSIDILKEDGSFVKIVKNENYTIIADYSTANKDDSVSFKTNWYSPENALIKTIEGTCKEGIIIGDLSITIDDITYSGEFDKDGHTLVEQSEENGDVLIYAYDEDHDNLLYMETEPETGDGVVMTTDWLGIPAIERCEEK